MARADGARMLLEIEARWSRIVRACSRYAALSAALCACGWEDPGASTSDAAATREESVQDPSPREHVARTEVSSSSDTAREGMVLIPESTGLECPAQQQQCARPVLEPFEIDVHEVTLAEYEVCVKAGGCSPLAAGPLCKAGSANKGPQYPVSCVDWEQATTYCAFVGKRLPMASEWRRAAGVDGGRAYPWGDEPPSCERAVYWPDYPKGPGPWPAGGGCATGGPLPVGSRPEGRSPYGVHDMVGNVFEWVQDVPRNVVGDPEEFRVLLGGAWYHHDVAALSPGNEGAWHRRGHPNDITGLRCARSYPSAE